MGFLIMRLIPFTETDWYGYGGAENWETENVLSSENYPVICEDDETYTFVADKNGISLDLYNDNLNYDSICYTSDLVFQTQAEAIETMSLISENATAEQIIKLLNLHISGQGDFSNFPEMN